MGKIGTAFRKVVDHVRHSLYSFALKIDKRLEPGIEKIPAAVKTVLVFCVAALAGESEWENKPYLSRILIVVGCFIAFGAVALDICGRKKPKGHK